MSKEKVIVGKIGGEDWVSTNDGGVGRLLFKLQDAVEVKEGLNKAHEHAKELGCRLHGMEKENASLREALRLKELECEVLAGNGDYYCQCTNEDCGSWYRLGKEGDSCKECNTGKLAPQQVEGW